MRWGIEQRLEFIEFRLFWDGGLNRSDITQQFGVSVPQASNDLSQYRELAPSNIRYDSSEKRYFATDEFQPKFLRPNPDRYLAQLKAIADHVMELKETWISRVPNADAMPIPTRKVDPYLLRRMLKAIRACRSVEVHYQSMNPKRPKPIWRRITPHAFGFDGLRWHVRAFCHIDGYFKDFILSRSQGIRGEADPGVAADQDRKWSSFFEVILHPNPQLSEAQRHTIATDYNMKNSKVTIPVRYALLYHFNKRLRLDVARYFKDPEETPLVISNKREFDKALEFAMAPDQHLRAG
jgi:hypothetical protein